MYIYLKHNSWEKNYFIFKGVNKIRKTSQKAGHLIF
jgi:hypothetical protein